MDIEELRDVVSELRYTGTLCVERHAALRAPDVPADLVEAICRALGDISVDEAIAALDREQREHEDEVARMVAEGGHDA